MAIFYLHAPPIGSCRHDGMVSIYHVPDQPESFRNFMFGNNNVKMYHESRNVLQAVSRRTLTPAMAMAPLPHTGNRIREMIHDQVDPTSLHYIQTCLHDDETCTVDRCHFMCLGYYNQRE